MTTTPSIASGPTTRPPTSGHFIYYRRPSVVPEASASAGSQAEAIRAFLAAHGWQCELFVGPDDPAATFDR